MRISNRMKKTLSTIIAVILIVGAVGAVAAFATNDSKPAGAMFKVGGLNPTTGKYVDTKQTIYTENAFDCAGLRVEPDFESTVTYDIYYYDKEGKLLDVVDGLEDVYDKDFEVAAECRIVIHPEIPEDVDAEDFEVKFWEVSKYANMLTVTNSKDGSIYGDFENLLDAEQDIEGYHLFDSTGSTIVSENFAEKAGAKVNLSAKVTKDYEYYDVWIYVESDTNAVYQMAAIFDDTGKVTKSKESSETALLTKPVWIKLTLEAPDVDSLHGYFIGVSCALNSDVYIYGYND